MADVSLDDLIKKDRETNKVNRLKQKLKPKKFVNRPNNNQEDRQPKGNQPNKRKPIQKRFNEPADNRRDNRGGRDFNDQPRERTKPIKPKFEKKEESEENKEKHFRTLRVMGLSPEFTNEDLYKLFATEGAMEKCHIEQDNFGRTLTTAIVKYYEPESARSAIQNLNRHKIMNCVLTVEPYKNVKK